MEAQFCPACKNEHIIGNSHCMICEFPFEGTDKEKSIHIGKFIGKKSIIQDSENTIDRSRNVLFFVVLLNLVGIAISYEMIFQNIFIAIFSFIIPTIILVCALLIKKAPIVFLGIPLLLMLLVYGSEIILNPSQWFRGIVFKVFVLGLLGYSIYNYVASSNFKKRYNQ